MGSEATLKLPVIDFTNLKLEANNPNWEAVKSQVHKALVDYGCFEAIFDKVPLELRKAIFAALQELFDLPLQTKILNVSKKPYHGYVGQYPMENVENMTNIMWPHGNPSFGHVPIKIKAIQSFSEQLSELDQIIRKMILESLGVEEYLEEHMNSTNYLLRNIVTILYQNEVEGLEVMNKDGKWISYKPSPDSFVVMIGDSLHAWSNGRLHSPFHRVIMSGNEARYSAGLFSIPKGGSIIKAPEELVDEEHPLLFKPFDHVEFLKSYYTEQGQRDQSALRTYCGV
ncbi:hypothetical protein AAZV13_08G193800 [Glycine max]